MTRDQHAVVRRAEPSKHALARMKEQAITDAYLRRALNAPDLIWPSSKRNVVCLVAYIGGRRLRAVVNVPLARIVTVYWHDGRG